MVDEPEPHFPRWHIGSQPLHVAFDGGRIVSDAGLLAVRALEKPLRVIADLAQRLPDPRSPKYIEHAAEALLTQAVQPILAGYPDGKDAQPLRTDPLFPILADVSPDAENPWASPSTRSRFPYAFPRRQAELPREDRPVLREIRAAQTGRVTLRNEYLVDRFLRTRRAPPAEVILAVDASDDPVQGHPTRSGQPGYYRQHPYLPRFVDDGATGFPRAAWRRPGTVHARLGAAAVLDPLGTRLRAGGPGVRIKVRADNGLAVPGLYDYGAANGLSQAFGYATNPVVPRATDQALADREWQHRCYRHREAVVQRFASLTDYQADSGPHPRRMVATIEVPPPGESASLRGHRPHGAAGRGLPRLLRAAGPGAGAAHRGEDERLAGGPLVGVRLRCQRLPVPGAYAGLRRWGPVPGGAGGRDGGGNGDRAHVAAAAVEGRRGRGDRRAADRVPPVGDVAVSGVVGARAGGGASVRAASADGLAGARRSSEARAPETGSQRLRCSTSAPGVKSRVSGCGEGRKDSCTE